MNFLRLFGDANARYLKSLNPLLEKINRQAPLLQNLNQAEIKAKTQVLKSRLDSGETLDDVLVEAFALIREAADRTLKQRHYDVQLLASLVLHKGQIAEMKTGEGKTLAATAALFLNALSGKGVHLVTVNDYLSRRDCVWMGQIFDYLGLSVSCIQHDSAYIYDSTYQASEKEAQVQDQGVKIVYDFLKPITRQEAYQADITYGTNNEFGFDYLRDNMVYDLADRVQRPLNFAIVDEVDSILIDEARTPLIISGPAQESEDLYQQYAKAVEILQENIDYNVDEKMHTSTLTDEGLSKVEKFLNIENIYEALGQKQAHHLQAALKARTLYKRDKDYVVRDGEVVIIDEFTGRMMEGRRFSEGLHQAIEAKEGVKVQRENITMATVTFQNYFRMYAKLAGMTGTAATEAEEFSKIYNLEVTTIPTNKSTIRKDLNDQIYKNEIAKFQAIAKQIRECKLRGQPILIGTISIEKNEQLSHFLEKEGIEHNILNAKNHEREAEIIAQAGSSGQVTLATNMAGRGVDIILGGLPYNKEKFNQVCSSGGLFVLGTERHESRRIDNQLRGRSGRQGDPGVSQFYVCLDDDLMRIFGSDRVKKVMSALNVPDDMPIENSMISKSIESAQKRVEGFNFDTRKHLVEYDDVINKQRSIIYKKRDEVLLAAINQDSTIIENIAWNNIQSEIDKIIKFHLPTEDPITWTRSELTEVLKSLFNLNESELNQYHQLESQAQIIDFIKLTAQARFDLIKKNIFTVAGEDNYKTLLKQLLTRGLDLYWIDHLEAIDYLRTGINLRAYGQQEPLVAYKSESFKLFQELLAGVQTDFVFNFFKFHKPEQVVIDETKKQYNLRLSGPAKEGDSQGALNKGATHLAPAKSDRPKDDEGHKIGRNDPCYCGSGKKFKHCHGK